MYSILRLIEYLFHNKSYNKDLICEECGVGGASVFCLHRVVCVECGGSLMNCLECNPDNRFYIVEENWLIGPVIRFLD
jgi:hypothetical protein